MRKAMEVMTDPRCGGVLAGQTSYAKELCHRMWRGDLVALERL